MHRRHTESATQKWTADDVKAKLRGRHAATQAMGVRTVPGPWTCIEELLGCDLIAFAAIQKPYNGPGRGAKYPRVGYEVKVSRADYRTELRKPWKRERAMAQTHAFYLAVPNGLLKPEERAQRAPWDDDGKKLWVPDDVGLVEVHNGGCRVVHQSPVRVAPEVLDAAMVGICARHISSHPDPRHEGLVAADRELCVDLRARRRELERPWDERMREARERGELSSEPALEGQSQ